MTFLEAQFMNHVMSFYYHLHGMLGRKIASHYEAKELIKQVICETIEIKQRTPSKFLMVKMFYLYEISM